MTIFSQFAAERNILITIGTVMILGPVFWAVDQNLTIFFMQLASLYVLVWVVLAVDFTRRIPRYHLYLSLIPILAVIFYLIPLPMSLWEQLPGHKTYADVIHAVSGEESMRWLSISLVPLNTEATLWAFIAPIAVYIGTLGLSNEHVRRLVLITIIVAVCQSFLGLVQYGGGIAVFDLVDNRYGKVATGTYLNRDHLAGFLEMVFPVILALVAAKLGFHMQHQRYTGTRWRFLTTLEGNQSLLYGLAAILVILCLVFTRSRTGLILTMVGLLFVSAAFYNRLGKTNIYGTYGSIVVVLGVIAIEIGLAPVLNRFSVDIIHDLRWELYATSMHGLADFFPLGSGPGTFSSVYPAYQVPHYDYFINHVHNDYLEWVFETGIIGLITIIVFLFMYFRNWKSVWSVEQWRTSRYVQVGAGIGIFLMLLHSFVDFNLHKPVNAMYFAFMFAVFMRAGIRSESPPGKSDA